MDRSTADGRRGGIRAAAAPPCPCWPGRASLFLAGAGGQATRALLLLVDKGKGTQDSRVPTGGDTSLLDFPLKKNSLLDLDWIWTDKQEVLCYVLLLCYTYMLLCFGILLCLWANCQPFSFRNEFLTFLFFDETKSSTLYIPCV